jgi:hypothetical protein
LNKSESNLGGGNRQHGRSHHAQRNPGCSCDRAGHTRASHYDKRSKYREHRADAVLDPDIPMAWDKKRRQEMTIEPRLIRRECCGHDRGTRRGENDLHGGRSMLMAREVRWRA